MDAYPQAGPSYQLLIKHLLDRPRHWTPDQRIIYRDIRELTYREFLSRVHRLAHLLQRLGVRSGDRVGVIDWDSHRYLELFFAVPMVGAVLHTINARLSPEQIQFTIQHAEDRILLVHPDFLPLLESFHHRCESVRALVLLSDHGEAHQTRLPLTGDYEALLAGCPDHFDFPEFGENTVATLFYTTGTTGEPKGVFFTHRQLVLHTLAAGFALGIHQHPVGFGQDDVYMPLTPMFHVHAWGVPYIATLAGVRQVYPGRYEPATLLKLLQQHQVTLSHCVPTILQMLLHHPESARVDFSRWKVITGGAALPPALARLATDRGIHIMQGYGMSETCPISSISQFKPEVVAGERDQQLDILGRTGFPLPLVQASAWGPDGKSLPPGKENTGELVLKAPWLTTGYFKEVERSETLWEGGWLHTGDMAYMDHDGYIRITDRLKDVIKIGGEWISSLELESILAQHEAVREVAVVGIPDPKWDERPLAVVVLRDTHRGQVTPRELMAFLHKFIDTGIVHKRAILTQIHIADALPRTSVGKFDKKALRSQAQAQAQAQGGTPPAA